MRDPLKYTPKYVLSLCLGGLIFTPLLYAPHGGHGEMMIFLSVLGLVLIYMYGLTQSRTRAQTSQERIGQFEVDSLFTFWMWGGWITLVGVLLSIIPLPWSCVEIIAPTAYDAWQDLFGLLDQSKYDQWIPISMSPAHSWGWAVTHLCWIIVVYCAVQVRGIRKPLLWSFSLLGPCLTLIGLIHLLRNYTHVYGFIRLLDREGLVGFITPVVNLNHTASLLMLSAFISLGLSQSILINDIERLAHPSRLSKRLYKCSLLSILISTIGLCLTSSRAAWVIYIALLSVWFIRRRLSSSSVFRLIVGLSVLMSMVLPVVYLLAASTLGVESSNLIKGQTWVAAVNLIKDYFPMGSGRGSFGEVFTHYNTFTDSQWASHAENFFIQSLSEGGVFGLLSILAYVVAWCSWWRSPDIKEHPVAFGIGLGVTAVGLHQQYDFGIETTSISVVFGIAWGLMWSYQSQKALVTPRKELELSSPKRKRGESKRLKSRNYRIWSVFISRILILICLHALLIMGSFFNNSPIKSVIRQIDHFQDQDLLEDAVRLHPQSAHLAIRYAQIEGPKKLEWIYHSHKLAPQWNSPYFAEARMLMSLGLEKQAMIAYHHLLKSGLKNRDKVFNDIYVRPLGVSETFWIPQEHWYSYYVYLQRRDRGKAKAFLLSIPTEYVSRRTELRGLWIRRFIPKCEVHALNALREHMEEERMNDQDRKGDKIDQALWRLDHLLISLAKDICTRNRVKGRLRTRSEMMVLLETEDILSNKKIESRKNIGIKFLDKAIGYSYLLRQGEKDEEKSKNSLQIQKRTPIFIRPSPKRRHRR